MKEDTQPLMVTIQCFTYNQESYIRECLDGFVMQKTNFRFEAIVHDDASTDGTVDIIREYEKKYPDIIKPIYETENQYSKHDGSLGRIMDEHTHGKYIAVCEGDDYWIDPLKLQKQVDFLETYLDYGLVHTNCFYRKDENNKLIKVKARSNYDAVSVLLCTGIATLTTCYRAHLYYKYLEEVRPQDKGWLMGDAPLWKYIANKSKIHLLPDYTAVYRILPESASHSKDINKRIAFAKSQLAIQKFMYEKFFKRNDINGEVYFLMISNHHFRMFNIYIGFREYKIAWNYIKKKWREIKKWDFLEISQIRRIAMAAVSALQPVRNK